MDSRDALSIQGVWAPPVFFSDFAIFSSLQACHFFSGVQQIRWTHIDYWNVLQSIPNKTVLEGELEMEVYARIVRRAVE